MLPPRTPHILIGGELSPQNLQLTLPYWGLLPQISLFFWKMRNWDYLETCWTYSCFSSYILLLSERQTSWGHVHCRAKDSVNWRKPGEKGLSRCQSQRKLEPAIGWHYTLSNQTMPPIQPRSDDDKPVSEGYWHRDSCHETSVSGEEFHTESICKEKWIEKEMAIHSSILAWKISWAGLAGYSPWTAKSRTWLRDWAQQTYDRASREKFGEFLEI